MLFITNQSMSNYLYKEKDEVLSNVEKVVVHFSNGKERIIYSPKKKNVVALNVSEFKSDEDNFIELVLSNYKGVESVEDFSAKCGYNSSKTFTRHFQKNLGTTPKQWLLQIRKRDVMHQLKNTSHSFSDIANKLGFSSASHLYHFCVNRIGETPGEIRRNRKSR